MQNKESKQRWVAARWERASWFVLWSVLSLPALWQLGSFVRTIAGRFGYDYDLEWMEGAALHHAFRIGEGVSSYHAP